MINTKIQQIAFNLGVSLEEAEQIYADDQLISKGQRLEWEMSKEQEKSIKKLSHIKPDKDHNKHCQRDIMKQKLITLIYQLLFSLNYNIEVSSNKLIVKKDNHTYTISIVKNH